MTPLDRWTAAIACAITGAPKAVLMAVAFHDGGKAGCTASVPRLAREAGLSPNATRRALHAMVELGLLSCKAPEYGTKVYRVQWDAVAAYVAPEKPARKKAETPPAEVVPLPQSDPSHSGTPTTDGGSPSQKGSPPLPEMDPNQETNLEENQEVLLSTSGKPKADPAPSYLDPTGISDSLKASKVSKGAWDVFDHWRQRQARPSTVKLTKARLSLLNSALVDYSTDAVISVIRLAYDAPVGPHGLPENYVKPWRTDNADRPGLEMLLRQKHIARNVEMAATWLRNGGSSQSSQTPGGPTPTQVYDLVCQWFYRGEIRDRVRTGRLGQTPEEHARRLSAIRSVGASAIKTRDKYTERSVRESFVRAYTQGAA